MAFTRQDATGPLRIEASAATAQESATTTMPFLGFGGGSYMGRFSEAAQSGSRTTYGFEVEDGRVGPAVPAPVDQGGSLKLTATMALPLRGIHLSSMSRDAAPPRVGTWEVRHEVDGDPLAASGQYGPAPPYAGDPLSIDAGGVGSHANLSVRFQSDGPDALSEIDVVAASIPWDPASAGFTFDRLLKTPAGLLRPSDLPPR